MNLNVYDMDNTLIDSAAAMKECQINGLYRATGCSSYRDMNKRLLELETLLDDKGLFGALEHIHMHPDTFFKGYYKTFSPFEAAEKGDIKVFDDVRAYFDKPVGFDFYSTGNHETGKRPFAIDAVVSNSSRDATINKLFALDIADHFNYIFAEFEQYKAKPRPYMAYQLVECLENDEHINKIRKIINVGDKVADIEFGEVLYDTLASKMGRKPEFTNYLIDRDKNYRWREPIKNAKLITSFMEI